MEAKDGPCRDCGRQYPPAVMHFDHRDPDKKLFAISMLGTRLGQNDGRGHAENLEKAIAEHGVFIAFEREVAKCDLVCAVCHAERTAGPTRGTWQADAAR